MYVLVEVINPNLNEAEKRYEINLDLNLQDLTGSIRIKEVYHPDFLFKYLINSTIWRAKSLVDTKNNQYPMLTQKKGIWNRFENLFQVLTKIYDIACRNHYKIRITVISTSVIPGTLLARAFLKRIGETNLCYNNNEDPMPTQEKQWWVEIY